MKKPWWEIKTVEQFNEEFMGKIVYEPYTPQRMGKVIEIIHRAGEFDSYESCVKVRWLKQTEKYPDRETIVRAYHLNDFEGLVNDHLKKYNKHLISFNKAKKL